MNTVDYIFGTLESNRTSINELSKSVTKLRRTQSSDFRIIAICFILLNIAMFTQMSISSAQDKQIKNLTKEIEELKRTKGE